MKVIHVSRAPAEERAVYMFEVDLRGGGRRRVYPVKPPRDPGTCDADTLERWLKRMGVTHVASSFDNPDTDVYCIADGCYSIAAYVAWWRLAEAVQ